MVTVTVAIVMLVRRPIPPPNTHTRKTGAVYPFRGALPGPFRGTIFEPFFSEATAAIAIIAMPDLFLHASTLARSW